MESIDLQGILLLPWIYGPLLSIAAVAALLLVKNRCTLLVSKVASRTSTRLDDLVLGAASGPLNLLIAASGILLLDRLLPLTEEIDRAFGLGYRACIVAAMVWFVDRLSRGLLAIYSERVPALSPARGVIQGLVRGLFLGLGILIFLDSIGVSITPLLASLGVGSLAVALALQDTLANLFAGMHMLADKSIEPGHFIRLETGQEGYVEKIGYRSTRIRMPADVMIIVPNSKLVGSVITNYDLPGSPTSLLVPAGVHYDSDLARVEAITLEVARGVLREVTGGVAEFEPLVRYESFADSSIRFNVVLRARNWPDGNQVRHEFIKRLHARYRAEKIVIPYPVRTLDIPDRVLERMAAAS